MRIVVVAALAAACSRQAAPYTPGLGEIMTLTQMRHAKLWLAGDAGNWPLASYELDELKEGFDDVVAFHPTHKDAPLPLSELIPKMMDAPLKDLGEAVAAKNRDRFAGAFDDHHPERPRRGDQARPGNREDRRTRGQGRRTAASHRD